MSIKQRGRSKLAISCEIHFKLQQKMVKPFMNDCYDRIVDFEAKYLGQKCQTCSNGSCALGKRPPQYSQGQPNANHCHYCDFEVTR